MQTETLKPCPFCGRDFAEVYSPSTADRTFVMCIHCASCGGAGKDEEHAIRNWNTRTTEAAEPKYKADFLWPYEDGTPEAFGYEFANARTEEYRKEQWEALKAALSSSTEAAEPKNKAERKKHIWLELKARGYEEPELSEQGEFIYHVLRDLDRKPDTEARELLVDALAGFEATQKVEDYPSDHWAVRAAAYLKGE